MDFLKLLGLVSVSFLVLHSVRHAIPLNLSKLQSADFGLFLSKFAQEHMGQIVIVSGITYIFQLFFRKRKE